MKTPARKPLPAPPGFKPKQAFAAFSWFQKWEIFDGVFTPGTNDISKLFRDLRVPYDLTGKRVLDVGTWNGCIAFECERRGAAEVVALGPEDPEATGFNCIKKWIGAKRTRHVIGTAYNLDPAVLGHFDAIFFCGVLYHLRYPILAIDNLRRVAQGDVYINTVLQTSTKSSASDSLSLYLDAIPCLRFFRNSELKGDFSNWFVPNRKAVEEIFQSAGFEISHLQKGQFRAQPKPGLPEFLAQPSCESTYYEELLSPVYHSHSLARFGGKLLYELSKAADFTGQERVARKVHFWHARYRQACGEWLKKQAFQFIPPDSSER